MSAFAKHFLVAALCLGLFLWILYIGFFLAFLAFMLITNVYRNVFVFVTQFFLVGITAFLVNGATEAWYRDLLTDIVGHKIYEWLVVAIMISVTVLLKLGSDRMFQLLGCARQISLMDQWHNYLFQKKARL